MGRRGFPLGYTAFLTLVVAVNAIGFAVSDFVRRLGPPLLGEAITYSPLVVDRDGKLLRPFTTKDGYWRLPATPAEVDARFLRMLIAYEDKRFYSHPGVDPVALARAAWQFAAHGRVISGGSTLTMQVARLLEPRPERSLSDKFAEMIRAIEIEQRLSKEQILTLYLALAPYGGNLEGVRAASLAYLGREPRRLSSAEAALLIALPQAPETRRPDHSPEAARIARDRVLARFARQGLINSDQAEAGMQEDMPRGRKAFPMLAAHIAERLIKKQPDAEIERTTISREIQIALEALARDRAQAIGGGVSAAIIVVDNATGEVRAHIGGVGYFDGARAGQVDLASALRSPGSALKPFIYGLAFEDGLVHPETLIDDRAVRFGAWHGDGAPRLAAVAQCAGSPGARCGRSQPPSRKTEKYRCRAGTAESRGTRTRRRARWRRRPAYRSCNALYRSCPRRRSFATRLAHRRSHDSRGATAPLRQGGGLAGRRCASRLAGA
jgi:penicillin-binding protein 1C